MAKIVITIKDKKDGSCNVGMKLDPPIRKEAGITVAQALGVVGMEAIKAAIRSMESEDDDDGEP